MRAEIPRRGQRGKGPIFFADLEAADAFEDDTEQCRDFHVIVHN